MAEPRPTCRTVDVDGQPVLARSRGPLTDTDMAALAEFRAYLQAQAKLKKIIERRQDGRG